MFIVGIFSGTRIGRSAWQPDARIRTLALFGGVDLDFRQAKIPAGGVKITSCSLLGGTRFIVPNNVPVTLGGISCFGGKENKRSGSQPGEAASADGLRITAYTLFGGIEVKDEP